LNSFGYSLPSSETPSGGGPLPLSVKWGLWKGPPHFYHLKMVRKEGVACGRQPIGAAAKADRHGSQQVLSEQWDCFGRRQVSPP